MAITQGIHRVISVKAVRWMPENSNAVTFNIHTEDGDVTQTLYFGEDGPVAEEFFYSLHGKPEQIVRASLREGE